MLAVEADVDFPLKAAGCKDLRLGWDVPGSGSRRSPSYPGKHQILRATILSPAAHATCFLANTYRRQSVCPGRLLLSELSPLAAQSLVPLSCHVRHEDAQPQQCARPRRADPGHATTLRRRRPYTTRRLVAAESRQHRPGTTAHGFPGRSPPVVSMAQDMAFAPRLIHGRTHRRHVQQRWLWVGWSRRSDICGWYASF